MDWLTRILRKVLGWRKDETAEHLPHIIKGQEPYSTRIDFNSSEWQDSVALRNHIQFFHEGDE